MEILSRSETTCLSPDVQTSVMVGRLRLFDKHRTLEPLEPNEAMAVALFLSATQPSFSPAWIRREVLTQMLTELPVEHPSPTVPLFSRGHNADFAIMVLQGKVKVVSGEEEFVCFLGPWSSLAMKALGPPTKSLMDTFSEVSKHGLNEVDPLKPNKARDARFLLAVEEGLSKWEGGSSAQYIPDFAAYAFDSSTRMIRIPRSAYVRSLKASLLNVSYSCDSGTESGYRSASASTATTTPIKINDPIADTSVVRYTVEEQSNHQIYKASELHPLVAHPHPLRATNGSHTPVRRTNYKNSSPDSIDSSETESLVGKTKKAGEKNYTLRDPKDFSVRDVFIDISTTPTTLGVKNFD